MSGFWRCFLLILCVTAMPFCAFAESAGTCGDNVTWTLSDDGILTVSGTGEMKDFAYDTETFAPLRAKIKSIVIEPGVTAIGDYAFFDCERVTTVSIPETVTTIGDFAFYDCKRLDKITLPDGVIEIGDYAFSRCEKLRKAYLGEGVTVINDHAFAGCTTLYEVTLGSRVLTVGENAFTDCVGLTTIKLPDSVTAIDAFAFANCTALHTVAFGNGVATIGANAFSGCSALTELSLPDSVNAVGNRAFCNCTNLKTVTIGKGTIEIGTLAFFDTPALLSVSVSAENPVYSTQNGVLFDKEKTLLLLYPQSKEAEHYTVPETVTEIDSEAFFCCKNLTALTAAIPLENIGANAFYHCNRLTTVTYGGTKSKWNNVFVSDFNEPLTLATFLFSNPEITLTETEVSANTAEGVLMVAGYDENNQLIRTKMLPNYNSTLADFSGCHKLKAFLWESLGTAKPLCEMEWIDIE